ncbi:MAG: hypothetical protein ACK45B_04750 [Limisphaerales bacterium]
MNARPVAILLALTAVGGLGWHLAFRRTIPSTPPAPAKVAHSAPKNWTVRARPLPDTPAVSESGWVRVFSEPSASSEEGDNAAELAAIAQAAAAVPLSEIPAQLDNLLDDPTSTAASLRSELLRRWAATDPAAASQWAEQLPPGPLRFAALRDIADTRAEENPADAIEWVNTLPDAGERAALTADFAYEIARTNGLAAVQMVTGLIPSRERDDALAHALRQWADADAATAAQWVDSVADVALRQRLLADLAEVYSQQNPAAAAALVSTALADSPLQNRAAVAVVQQWAQTAPAEAARWVEQFPMGETRQAATENLLLLWAAREAAAPAQWVESLPPGEVREAARLALQHAQSLAAVTAAAALVN